MHKRILFVALVLVACAPYKPVPTDSGTPKDAAKEATACVPDGQPCNGTEPCCIQSSVCNINTGICQTACVGIGNLCTVNGDCCSGICNGTCQ